MITLFTDASYCNKKNVAGWGSWVKADGWPTGRTYGGQLQKIYSSGEAELLAVERILEILFRSGHMNGHETIIIQSDSMHALDCIMAHKPIRSTFSAGSGKRDVQAATPRNSPLPHGALDIVKQIEAYVLGRAIYLRHVKGHNGGESTRSWVNEKCDYIARQNLDNARRSCITNQRVLESESQRSGVGCGTS